MRWHIGQHAGRREPGLERERIREGFECGAGLARCQRPIDRPAVLRVRVVTRSLPGQPLAASVVQDDDRDVGGAVPLERLPVAPDDADDVGLESGVERSLDARREIRSGLRFHHLDKMRRQKWRRRARKAQTLVLRLARLIGGQRAGRLHPPKHGPLSRNRLVALAKWVVPGRPLRQAGQKRGLCGRQHRRFGGKVGSARPAGADHLIAVPARLR